MPNGPLVKQDKTSCKTLLPVFYVHVERVRFKNWVDGNNIRVGMLKYNYTHMSYLNNFELVTTTIDYDLHILVIS